MYGRKSEKQIAFLEEIERVCKEHGYIIIPEDYSCLEIKYYDEASAEEYILNAYNGCEFATEKDFEPRAERKTFADVMNEYNKGE